jgi:CRISPR/Cas system CSM-associated protein Csm2 small subunit
MDKNRPISRELEMMMPALAQTMKYAVQAVNQSSALYEVLLAKGLVTKAEIDEKMRSTEDVSKKLFAVLDESIRKMS